ncbi:unnamed protein product [Adineta ricciae]|uniref:Cilia- and flagella-associated protein 69 ARM repeats domain-containing protein n=1 Tax=Adineta ricciae TaxID=249248 RepID=A0A814PTL2_ADIRI|nr:unnamed protein product [Adineta ricciae]
MSIFTVQQQQQQQQLSVSKSCSLPRIPQNRLPVVHILTSRSEPGDVKRKEPFQFEKVARFFLDPHTAHLTDRRLRFCQKLLRCHENGYILKDVPYLMQLLNVLAGCCEEQPVYVNPFIEIVKNCSKPFLLDKSTDAEIYASALIAFCSDFGYLLRVSNKRIQRCILETLYKSIQPTNKSPIADNDFDGLRPIRIDYLLKIHCYSDLCETLVKTISMFENDLSLRIQAVKLLQIYSSKSLDCVARMLTHDCINRLVAKMNDADPTGELLFRTTEVLWNIFDFADEEQIGEQLDSRVTISLLQEAFIGQVTQNHSQYHCQLRNDLLIVCSRIIAIKPDAPVIETGFAKQLLLLASYPELRSNNPLVKNLKITTSEEDFEFKKLLINTVVLLGRNPVINDLITNSRVLLALLSYVEPLPRKKNQLVNAFEWSLSQLEELQLHALVALSILLPRSLQEYLEYHTSTRLLLFYEWTLNGDVYQSQGNGFFGKGGRNSKRSQLKYIMRLLRSIVSTKDEGIFVDLCDQGLIPLITGHLKRLLRETSNHIDYIDLDLLCDGLFVLSCLGELDIHRKEIFGSEGIEILTKVLLSESSHVCGGLGYYRLLVAAIDCVWCCVIGSVINEDEFIQKQGLFALLDLIEANPKSLQNIILGCLLDLTENTKCLHFIMAWQGRKQQQFPHVLCELWRDEEREIHVARTGKGVIEDHRKPLMGILQQSAPVIPLKSVEPPRSVLDLIDNMRSKIYGFFCKIGFGDLPGLHEEDFVTLCIIENFLDFKLGEVWQEIMMELDMEGTQVIATDGEATDTILRAAEERGLAVTATQNYILEQYHKQDLHYEKSFYHEIIRNHQFQEKGLEQWKAYLARTSKYPLLMVAKDAQNESIQQSRPDEKSYTGYHTVHNLEIPNLSITAFTGRVLHIESTPVELLNKGRRMEFNS